MNSVPRHLLFLALTLLIPVLSAEMVINEIHYNPPDNPVRQVDHTPGQPARKGLTTHRKRALVGDQKWRLQA